MCENTTEPKYIHELTAEEKDILIRFRLLSEENKQLVLDYVTSQKKAEN